MYTLMTVFGWWKRCQECFEAVGDWGGVDDLLQWVSKWKLCWDEVAEALLSDVSVGVQLRVQTACVCACNVCTYA